MEETQEDRRQVDETECVGGKLPKEDLVTKQLDSWLTGDPRLCSSGILSLPPGAAQRLRVTEVTVSGSCLLFLADSCPYSFHNSLALYPANTCSGNLLK